MIGIGFCFGFGIGIDMCIGIDRHQRGAQGIDEEQREKESRSHT